MLINSKIGNNMGYYSMNRKKSANDKMKLAELIEKELSPTDPTPLNSYEIKNYIYYGFSDDNIRHIYWKLLFNYYTDNLFKTELFYKRARKKYLELIKKIDWNDKHVKMINNLILTDLRRTSLLNTKDLSIDKESLRRILVLFSSKNSEIGYIQGMINLVIPIYYVLSGSKDLESLKYIEEDTYFMFQNFMNEYGKNFIVKNNEEAVKSFDNKIFENLIEKTQIESLEESNKDTIKDKKSDKDSINQIIEINLSNSRDKNDLQIENDLFTDVISGSEELQKRINTVLSIIKNRDSELFNTIIKKKIEVSCFIAKWILFMFSTEFPLEKLLWLWDRILSDSYRFEILEFCCASIFILLKNVIMTQEYSKCMEVIQNLSIIDVEVMFDISDVLRRNDSNTIKIIKKKLQT